MNIIAITSDICCFLFLLLLIIIYNSKEKIANEENRIYKWILICNFIVLVVELLFFLSIYYFKDNIIIISVLEKIYFIYILFWILLFSYYIVFISNQNNPKIFDFIRKKHILKIIIIAFIIGVLIVLLPLEHSYSNGYIAYSYGLAPTLMSIIAVIMISLDFISTIINIKKLNKTKIMPLFAFSLLVTLFFIIHIFNPSILLITLSITLISYLMYNTIENPDIKMLREVEIAKDQAEKANHAKSDFLSNMSHEIRTPLNAIVGFSQSLKDEELSSSAQEKIDDIIMASNNLLEIVNSILDISKIEANKLEIVNKEYETKELFDELIVLTKARMGDKGLDFRVNIESSIPGVLYGDNQRLKQIILNLLTNSVKYTKEGFIDFRVSSVIKNNVCRLIISVEDSGIGIKNENLSRLFSKFERLNVEKSLTIEGTGLGLAITKKLVDLMNGKIVVQSVYGEGSKFTVSIDQRIVAMTPPQVKSVKNSSSKAINAKGVKALIVDDNPLNIKVASTLIKKYNFNIDTANSGFECLEKLDKGNKYDIIFLDDMMPKMSGRETLTKMKQKENFKTPVIALTANAIDGMKEEYLSLGFNDYLSKPIEKNELERVIRTFITKVSHDDVNALSTEPKSIINLNNYRSKKVLLVDDNELNIKVAVNLLKKNNLDITPAKSGSECISFVIDTEYDLILLDDMMPDLDGCKTLENLKSLEDFKTPVVMMTASKEDEVSDKIKKYGFDGYLGKPIIKDDLEKILNEFLN